MIRLLPHLVVGASAALVSLRLPGAWTPPDLLLLAAIACALPTRGVGALVVAATLGHVADLLAGSPPGTAPATFLAAALAGRSVGCILFTDRLLALLLATLAGVGAAAGVASLLAATGLPARFPAAPLYTLGAGPLVLWPWARLAATAARRPAGIGG